MTNLYHKYGVFKVRQLCVTLSLYRENTDCVNTNCTIVQKLSGRGSFPSDFAFFAFATRRNKHFSGIFMYLLSIIISLLARILSLIIYIYQLN